MKAQSIKEKKKRKIKPKITEKDVSKCRRTHLTAFPLLYQASEKKIVKKKLSHSSFPVFTLTGLQGIPSKDKFAFHEAARPVQSRGLNNHLTL